MSRVRVRLKSKFFFHFFVLLDLEKSYIPVAIFYCLISDETVVSVCELQTNMISQVNRSLEKRAGLSKNVNTARYKSEYISKFSPTKGSVPRPSSPIQTSKSNFVDSKTNLPIGKKPGKSEIKTILSNSNL